MAGIYLHIPFCRQACTYCNFHFTTSLRHKAGLVEALEQELLLRRPYLEGAPVETVYFGGGTPSLLSLDECRRLLDAVRRHYPVQAGAEITWEANPDDITPEKIRGWMEAGINRLSIGVQSFFEEDLRWMNRAHSAAQAQDCIRHCQESGLTNLSIDLIYGSPGLTDARWEANVRQAIDLQIPHLSCYALTVEEKTPLHKMIRLQKAADTDGDAQAQQFLLLMQWLRAAGYEHYEVSNFARPGMRSRHNSSYWRGVPYLGIGPSAHSFNGRERSWNIAHNARYIESVSKGLPAAETEVLTPEQALNECIMISLRTKEGLNLDTVAERWGMKQAAALEKPISRWLSTGRLERTGNTVVLTDEGMLMADGIAADLF
ncbi:MAG TPA: radical SAM family heme chaperone HemW, partial [Chitinophagaceae bacterium]|nr:radical SAM family heme chaperone HemW [Chitinophagaceae bacterium]